MPKTVAWVRIMNRVLRHRLRKAERALYSLETENTALRAAIAELTEMNQENDNG